jgi:hypothetical protein
MARRQMRDRHKERSWRRHLQEWEGSGDTIRGYCRRQRLSEASFHFWRAELRRRDQERTASVSRRRSSPSRRLFVPVVVQQAAVATAIEVVAANGRVIRVSAGIDAAAFRQVLAVVEERPC